MKKSITAVTSLATITCPFASTPLMGRTEGTPEELVETANAAVVEAVLKRDSAALERGL